METERVVFEKEDIGGRYSQTCSEPLGPCSTTCIAFRFLFFPQIMVSNLPFDTSTEELEAFASQAGQVVNVKIILDRETGRSKGYGFVLFTEPLSATYALERLDGMELGGRPLKIRPAIRKTYPNTRGGGGYGGDNNY